MQEWLGLGTVDPVALWLLFLSFSSSVLQVHYINWMRCVHQQPGQQQPQQEEQQQQERRRQAQGRLSRGGSFDGIESPRAGMSAPLLANIPQQSQQEQHTTVQITASPLDLEASPAAALASGRDDITASLLWQPMALAAQGQWHWQDWARYFIYRLGIIAGAPHCLPAANHAPAITFCSAPSAAGTTSTFCWCASWPCAPWRTIASTPATSR